MYLHYWVSQSREAATIHCINFNMSKAIFKNATIWGMTVFSSILYLSRKPGKRQQRQDSWVYGTWDMLQALKTPSRSSSQPVPGWQDGNKGADYPI